MLYVKFSRIAGNGSGTEQEPETGTVGTVFPETESLNICPPIGVIAHIFSLFGRHEGGMGALYGILAITSALCSANS